MEVRVYRSVSGEEEEEEKGKLAYRHLAASITVAAMVHIHGG